MSAKTQGLMEGGRETGTQSLIEAFWTTPEGLRKQAAGYAYDNQSPGSPGWCNPDKADWTQELLTAEQLTNIFGCAEEACAWIKAEIEADREDGMNRDWHLLLEEDIHEEVVVFMNDGKAYVWDGWHRIAASITKGCPVKAIVGRRQQKTELGTGKHLETVKATV